MPVDVEKLTELYIGGPLRDWLYNNAPIMLGELDRIRKMGLGDELLQARIIDTYDTIMKSELKEKFSIFIKKNPELLVDEVYTIDKTSRMMLGPCDDPNGIFSNYNPGLLRFPMQLIFMSDDKDMLVHAITEFTKSHPNLEYYIQGSFAYVEYVPEEFINILDKIPDNYWELKQR